jgi:hypothetical protein
LNTVVVTAAWSYPYDLENTPINIQPNATQTELSSSNDVKPSAQFFVFTGVTSMLLSLGFIILYVLMDRQYRNNERIPIVDLSITLIWTIFWIAGSSAWAQGVSNLRSETSHDYVSSLVLDCNGTTICPNYTCELLSRFSFFFNIICFFILAGAYGNVTVSVIFGFLNFLLWLGCIWFVYKETKFFKTRTAQQQPQHNNFSNFDISNMQQPPPRVPGTIG